MILGKTETSKTVATSNKWQTPIDLSIISDFSGFYQTRPIHSRHPTAIDPTTSTSNVKKIEKVNLEL